MFYDGSELLSRSKYKLFFSLGGRNIGKSTFWMKMAIRNFIKYKKKFAIIVKFKDDLKEFAEEYFTDKWMHQKHTYPDYDILLKKNKLYIRHKDGGKWQHCGYAIAIKQQGQKKSTTAYHDVDDMYFEEAIPLDDRYIKNSKQPLMEPKLLISLYQTIARGTSGEHTRPVRLFIISNNYTLNNPYFQYFKILPVVTSNPNSIFQRFYTYDDKKLHWALEFSQLQPEETGLEVDEDDLGIQFNDYRNELKYSKDRPKKIVKQITFDNKYIINIANYNDSIILYKGKKIIDNEDICCYSCSEFKNSKTIGINILKKQPDYNVIIDLYERNLIYYDRLETFINLTNILAFTGKA